MHMQFLAQTRIWEADAGLRVVLTGNDVMHHALNFPPRNVRWPVAKIHCNVNTTGLANFAGVPMLCNPVKGAPHRDWSISVAHRDWSISVAASLEPVFMK